MNMQSQYYGETVINRIFWLNKHFQVVLVSLIPCIKLYNENQFFFFSVFVFCINLVKAWGGGVWIYFNITARVSDRKSVARNAYFRLRQFIARNSAIIANREAIKFLRNSAQRNASQVKIYVAKRRTRGKNLPAIQSSVIGQSF